ncbi:polysaccharide deacetylase family protein [Candidatus Poribacteria bacterium]|nr:polysaccharide deacetylase family protein [Candidatus Poribacteria bacterium]
MPGKRDIAVRFLALSGITRLKELLGRKDRLLVLVYHRICETEGFMWDDDLVSASPQQFERQVRYIAERFTPITFEELGRILDGRSPMPPRPVIVTFDDGYMDNYLQAFPILKRYGVPATFFIPVGFIGTRKVTWWDLKAFKRKNARQPREGPEFMGWEEIEEMAEWGMEFGSHTVSHISLAKASDVRIKDELSASKSEMEHRLGREITAFAYPYGEWDERAVKLVREAGFRFAVTLEHGLNRLERCRANPFALKRIAVERRDSFDSFRAKIGFPKIIRY